jgi:hypothetical protein
MLPLIHKVSSLQFRVTIKEEEENSISRIFENEYIHVFQIQVLCFPSIIVIHMLLVIVHHHLDVEIHYQDRNFARK